MATTLIGYARCSTDKQDLAAQKAALETLGVAVDRIYTDYGLTGTNRSRPGLDQALAAVRTGDTLVVPKLDRLARSVPDARFIADALIARGVRLALGSSVYDPVDPMGKMFFNILATFAGVRGGPDPAAHPRGAWRSRVPGASCAASSPSSPTVSRRSCTGCTAPASTPSATWPSCSRCPAQQFTGPLGGNGLSHSAGRTSSLVAWYHQLRFVLQRSP